MEESVGFVTCFLFGPLVPKLTFSVPFFGVGESPITHPLFPPPSFPPALSSLHFSQINQPAAAPHPSRPGFRPTAAAPIPGSGTARWAAGPAAGNSLEGRFPAFRRSATSSLTACRLQKLLPVARGHAVGLCCSPVCPVAAAIGGPPPGCPFSDGTPCFPAPGEWGGRSPSSRWTLG